MRYGLLLIDLNGSTVNGEANVVRGGWVKSYDPDGHDGGGDMVATFDPAEALAFDSFTKAMECWRAQSTVKPMRPDGKPNRPLTAWSVSVERLP